ncbi:MAG: hypothetical protein IMZ69_09405 [Spirochaetes bacterium]|nr:hypothetical protein [Spirochaetota bacterium]
MKEYWELVSVDPKKVVASPDRKKWGKRRASILSQSPEVCRAYWQAVIDGNWDQASQAYPGRSADGWKKAYSKNRPVQIIKIGPTHPPRPNDGTTNPVTPCILKYADGKMREVRMCTAKVKGKCAIVASLGATREIGPDEPAPAASSQPSKD